MKTLYSEGDKLNFNGFKCRILQIVETYRKNVLVVKIEGTPKHTSLINKVPVHIGSKLGLFEMPNGAIEFMNIIE